MTIDSVALRLQLLDQNTQVLVLSHVAQARGATSAFSPAEVEELFTAIAIPRPSRVSNNMAVLERAGLLTRGPGRGAVWRVTPLGRRRLLEIFSEADLPALLAQVEAEGHTTLGGYSHPIVPVSLAPPELAGALRSFLAQHPFETNVFAMTRFPTPVRSVERDTAASDPVVPALEAAREVCKRHGFELHLASDRAMSDDLWSNVAAHMWASKYGIAFFEDRAGRGLNYNMTIEVGSMLMTGRRCALLKDASIAQMPTDLVGRIYKEVDLNDSATVASALEVWITKDLGVA